MLDNNSTTHVFRFLQLRDSRSGDEEGSAALAADTAFARSLSAAPASERSTLAQAHLDSSMPQLRRLMRSASVRAGLADVGKVLRAKGSVGDLKRAMPAQGRTATRARSKATRTTDARESVMLSDALLAAKFATRELPTEIQDAAILFQASCAVRQARAEDLKQPLQRVLARHIVLPTVLSTRATAPLPAHESPARLVATSAGRSLQSARELVSAVEELARAHRADMQRRPAAHASDAASNTTTDSAATPLLLSSTALERFSAQTRNVLSRLGADTTSLPVPSLVSLLEGELAAVAAAAATEMQLVPTPQPVEAALSLTAPQVKPTGIAELLVVKQHLLRYQRADIAHVENIIVGETKRRTHRTLEHIEETTITERETIKEQETELEKAERFEIKHETERTITRDQQFGFGLSISGKYGPAVEFSSNVTGQISSSSQEMARDAVTYAKDIVERSLERVTERVREEQIRRVIHEQEETNLHELKNETAQHIVGAYQFLEKVYQSQVFNYGLRQMFDFMVPEPASYLWYLEGSPGAQVTLPPAPPRLEDKVSSALGIDAANYLGYAAQFGASGVETPPPLLKRALVTIKHGESGDEEGKPRSILEKEVPIPEGYLPWIASVTLMALTDDELTVAVTVGSESQSWAPRGAAVLGLGGGHTLAQTVLNFIPYGSGALVDPQTKLVLNVLAYESNTYSAVADVTFYRSDEVYKAWQIKTYDTLAAASAEAQLKHEQKVEELRMRAETEAARAGQKFGAAPSQNAKVINAELKKHCISTMTQQWYDGFNATVDADPPYFDLAAAAEQGSFVRFFEQAFEWDQLQYVCYPYFWARKTTWWKRFRRVEVDYAFQEFLRAGAARVVVPVRPGFEEAVMNYLDSISLGSNPQATVPLYTGPLVPIVDEIRERTGAPQGEVAVGDPWETVVPTPLVVLRSEAQLPKWTRQNAANWDWSES